MYWKSQNSEVKQDNMAQAAAFTECARWDSAGNLPLKNTGKESQMYKSHLSFPVLFYRVQ